MPFSATEGGHHVGDHGSDGTNGRRSLGGCSRCGSCGQGDHPRAEPRNCAGRQRRGRGQGRPRRCRGADGRLCRRRGSLCPQPGAACRRGRLRHCGKEWRRDRRGDPPRRRAACRGAVVERRPSHGRDRHRQGAARFRAGAARGGTVADLHPRHRVHGELGSTSAVRPRPNSPAGMPASVSSI